MKKIVISGINIHQGGPMTILISCLDFMDKNLAHKYEIIALVHDKDKFNHENIKLIEFPLSRKSWLARIYYEYFYFKRLSKEISPNLWFSIHDITPNVLADIRVVYCHNPSLFHKLKIKDILLDGKFFLFASFYKYLYQINIKDNDFIVVQQDWIRDNFRELFKIDKNNIIVAHCNDRGTMQNELINFFEEKNLMFAEDILFFYPALPRIFKNIEVVCEAAKYLSDLGNKNFKVKLTIDGNENNYSRQIVSKYSNVDSIDFIGIQPYDEIQELYKKVACLIFPSKLETWGLPITEFKELGKPMLCVDLPYAHETIGDYNLVSFFKEDNYVELANLMLGLIKNDISFGGNEKNNIQYPFAENWEDLFSLILCN